jgi:hypothetical protein
MVSAIVSTAPAVKAGVARRVRTLYRTSRKTLDRTFIMVSSGYFRLV